ncbi:MAG: hypothetical protein Q8S92_15540 [Hydrogenophaga sp.]|uniref:hypothetical protein n=1 Tax=Hydrogenophaga sp. TaxID=1904254 RepID=UPI002733E538|nr:hypothetical protein [Hydrogenophaga sp.]MDP3350403.1 hypothetical protein [Hydrogenophaga sp.]
MTQPSAPSAHADVRLYIYDTSNGWCAQAQAASDVFHGATGNAPDAVDAAWTLVTNVMALQAQGRPLPLGSGLQLSPDATDMCMHYLASSLTFEKVCEAYGRPSGHWLVVMYRFEEQEPILRPAFLMHPSELLTRNEVASWVAQAVEHDRNAHGSEVHRLVFNGTGPKLSPLLR